MRNGRCWRRLSRGTVNLLAMRPLCGHTKSDAQQSSGCDGNPADIRPHLKRTHPCGAVLDGGDMVAAKVEEVRSAHLAAVFPVTTAARSRYRRSAFRYR